MQDEVMIDIDNSKDDCISRKAVLELVADMDLSMGQVVKGIHALPSVQPKAKTGHWNCGDDMFEYAICSSCKHETGEAWEYAKRNFKYCPNCGCRMESEG